MTGESKTPDCDPINIGSRRLRCRLSVPVLLGDIPVNRTIVTAILVLTALFSAQPEAIAELGVEVVFSDGEIAIIGVWYRDHRHKQSHGNGGKPVAMFTQKRSV